jgi:hypothetical protein
MVDALCQILLPEVPLIAGMEIDGTHEIDGVVYERIPRRIVWNDFVLEFDQATDGMLNHLPPRFSRTDWIWLKVTDETLDRYDSSVKSVLSETSGTADVIENCIQSLLANVDRWVVIFLLHYDQIDTIFPTDVNGLIDYLRKNLDPNSVPEGFIAYSDKSS